ncbi:MAG: cyclopropane-fatty-acyl-phospholipid synthase family protein [bacterium]
MISGIDLAERGLAPDSLVRAGIKRLLKDRLKECQGQSGESAWDQAREFFAAMNRAPLALHTADANAQHYEVPTEFYDYCLGPRKKYSSCYFNTGRESLAESEELMLEKTCQRAELRDGQAVLELGCGWGSLSLWMAERFPKSSITAVSNSRTQREYIEKKASEKGIRNLSVITCDMNNFTTDRQFDRVVSVEMFEHMRNWQLLFEKISTWLKPDGKLFFHIFVHRFYTYPFETDGDDNWMGRHFFTGGIMPAFDLPLRFQEHLKIESQWLVDGHHYGQTAELWLKNLDANRARALEVFRQNPNPQGDSPTVMLNRWRIFFMACAELWNYEHGREWCVGHYLFSRRG